MIISMNSVGPLLIKPCNGLIWLETLTLMFEFNARYWRGLLLLDSLKINQSYWTPQLLTKQYLGLAGPTPGACSLSQRPSSGLITGGATRQPIQRLVSPTRSVFPDFGPNPDFFPKKVWKKSVF